MLASSDHRGAGTKGRVPANRAASKRLLREARQKVWHNTELLHRARLDGDAAYRRSLAELEILARPGSPTCSRRATCC